jgi:hypothetical protein
MAMSLQLWRTLQQRLDTFEAALLTRKNVIRFLSARFLLMLAMVLGFWLALPGRP